MVAAEWHRRVMWCARRWVSSTAVVVVAAGSLIAGPGSSLPQAVAGSLPSVIAFDDNIGVAGYESSGILESAASSKATAGFVNDDGLFATFSPDGLHLAYIAALSDGDFGIDVADRNGAHPRTLFKGPWSFGGYPFKQNPDSIAYPLAWSPDGTELAYGCDGDEPDASSQTDTGSEWIQICLLNVDTGKHDLLTNPHKNVLPADGTGMRFSWSPDGKDIYTDIWQTFACPSDYPGTPPSSGCGTTEIGEVNATTGSESIVDPIKTPATTSAITSSEDPVVSPDGTEILDYTGTQSESTTGISVLDLEGGGSTLIRPYLESPQAQVGAIWSPNGKDILFVAYDSSGYDAPYLVTAADASGTPTELFYSNYKIFNLQWAPTATICTVPKVVGQTLAKTKELLKKAACSLGTVTGPKSHRSSRKIDKQSPAPDLDEPAGTKVDVRLK